MISLTQLNEKVLAEINLRVKRSMENPKLADLTNEAEMTNFHRPFVVNDVVIQLFDIVKALDSYLQQPSVGYYAEQMELRQKLRAMIDKI